MDVFLSFMYYFFFDALGLIGQASILWILNLYVIVLMRLPKFIEKYKINEKSKN
jgi:hypothetical protein